jgi:hypothetical protein
MREGGANSVQRQGSRVSRVSFLGASDQESGSSIQHREILWHTHASLPRLPSELFGPEPIRKRVGFRLAVRDNAPQGDHVSRIASGTRVANPEDGQAIPAETLRRACDGHADGVERATWREQLPGRAAV